MSRQSPRQTLLLICVLGALTFGMIPAQAAAPQQSLPAALPAAATTLAATSKPTREVFGFALGSSLSDPTHGYPSWNFNLLTTVAYFGLHVLWNGAYQADSGLTVWNSSQLTNLVATAHAHGTKVVLTIISSDSTGVYPNALCDALIHGSVTIRNTVAQVKAKGVDGVNVDYEGVNQACGSTDPSWAQHAFTGFMASLRSALGSSYYLSVDTYASSAGDPAGFFDVAGLNASVDSFFVMAYDMEYSNFYHAPTSCGRLCLGPTSPLGSYYYNDTAVMSQYSSAVTPAKVIFGVPYYGRKACVANATAEYQHPIGAVTSDMYMDAAGESTDPSVRPGSFVAHRDANDPAGRERWDTWYSTTLNCTRQLFWDDATSLGYKYDLVNRDGLRGVGIWTLNYGGAANELWLALANHFGGWHAAYDLSKAPTAWVAGQSQTFAVTVTNTGGAPWPSTGHNRVDLDLHFTTVAGGSAKAAYWLNSQVFPLPADLTSGNSVTLNVTLAAPARTGPIVLEAQMIKEHQFWFKQWTPMKTTVAAPLWAGTYDLTHAPKTWTLLASQTFPVTVTNTGNTTWPSAGYYRADLDLHFSSRTGGSAASRYWTSSQAFSLPGDLAPGKSATVTVTVKAPPGAGSMFLEAEMIKEHQFWFKQYRAITVIAAPPGWSAAYNVTTVPTAWVAGKPQTFSVSITNNGTQAWPSTGFTEVDLHVHFATSAGGAANRVSWISSNAFKLPKNVAAGQSVTVAVTVTAPRAGALVLELEMIKEHQFWFVQAAPVSVTVS
jgi:spore germination protein YaaH